MNRTILHVDMDAFFASVEVLDNPELRGQPIVVGSPPEARGVVAAASYEARKFGIHSAMSSYRALQLCRKLVIIKPRMERYVEVSAKIRAIFLSYTPLVEPISIDEAFLDVTGSNALYGTGIEIGRAIKNRIKDELQLTASVGVATNKFLAKIASDLEKPNGFVIITRENAGTTLAELPVSKLWGVGKVTQKELASLNVHKVKDLFTCPRQQLEALLGSYTGTLLELARGIDDREVITEGMPRSVGAETTFPQDISDREELQKKLSILVERVARELRETGLKAKTINIKARFPDFTTITRAQTLPSPTSATRTIRDTAHRLFQDRVAQKPLRLIGVSVSNLITPGEGQQELFPDEDEEKAEAIDRAKDELQDRFGPNALRSGVEL